jgi:N-acetylmuramoyl-L-alanine amidase
MARRALGLALLALALGAAPADAKVAHTVARGETLWSIAAANNLTTRSLALFNGLSVNARVVRGSTVWVPTVAEAGMTMRSAGAGPSPARAAAPRSTAATVPRGARPGGYVVQRGDTLSAIAARSGVSLSYLARTNGLNAGGKLLAGTRLSVPAGGSRGAPSVASAPRRIVPSAPRRVVSRRTGTRNGGARVTSGQIAAIAREHGVPASLASAIGWQESGFNNARVSSANARGVMQVMPGTWSFVEQNLAGRTLDPSSPNDNMHAGVMYLRRLLRENGGDPAAAAAAYYQGPGSVRRRGVLPGTRRYVRNVQALQGRFGGP